MKYIKLILIFTGLSILLSACRGAAIVPIESTQSPAATIAVNPSLPAVTFTPITFPATMTAVPAATATTAQSQSPQCTNSADFISDVSVPDESVFSPDVDFVKTWRVKNSGTCIWDNRYSLVFTDGTLMMPVDRVSLSANVSPGQSFDLSLNMTSPIYPGSYESDWKFQAPDGSRFGVGQKNTSLWVKINVGSPRQTTITGFIYQDINGNSLVDGSDILMANREVWLQKGGCDMGGDRVAAAISGSDGRYVMSGTFSGTFCLGLMGQDGMEDVATLSVELSQTLSNWNLRASIPNAGISGMLWSDMQPDGIWQSIEPYIPGVAVLLQRGPCANPTSQVPVTAVTDSNGLFSFNSLYGGTYCVSIHADLGSNMDILGSGIWTVPVNGGQQVTIRPGEQKSVSFGWQYK